MKTLISSLVDSFLCIMLVSFGALALTLIVAPFVMNDPAWHMVFAFPFLCVTCICFVILDGRG